MSVFKAVAMHAKCLGQASLLTSVLLSNLVAMSAQAEGQQDFKLVNKTGYTIAELYVSPSKINNWQDDVLGKDRIYMSYGYLAASGPREFYEVLEKVVD